MKIKSFLLEELDGIKHLKTCGGSGANTLFTLQQMGAKTFYSCKIGSDDAGDFFYRDLLANGVHTNLHELPREGVTGKCIVLVTPDADRTMNTFLGATSSFSPNKFPKMRWRVLSFYILKAISLLHLLDVKQLFSRASWHVSIMSKQLWACRIQTWWLISSKVCSILLMVRSIFYSVTKMKLNYLPELMI